MKFTLSTKPLITAANLVIINSNVNKFDHKSIMVQISASKTHLVLNTESNSIMSEIKLAGMGTDDNPAILFVDALIFKSLISTIKGSQVELDFGEGSLMVSSGKSHYSIPVIATANDGSFRSPAVLTEEQIASAPNIDLAKWKLIKDHQLFAKSESYSQPVYTYAWFGAAGDVVVGDLVQSWITHSKSSQLDINCLIKDNIINLITSLPENTKLVRVDDNYVLYISADSYEYRSQIVPVIESKENGEYGADAFIAIMVPDEKTIKVNSDDIITVLNQSALLTTDKTPIIQVTIDSEGMHLKDKRVDATIAIEGEFDAPISIPFKAGMLKSLISNCPDSKLEMWPRYVDGNAVGLFVHTKDYTSVLGGSED